jgi:hypothetical protein
MVHLPCRLGGDSCTMYLGSERSIADTGQVGTIMHVAAAGGARL